MISSFGWTEISLKLMKKRYLALSTTCTVRSEASHPSRRLGRGGGVASGSVRALFWGAHWVCQNHGLSGIAYTFMGKDGINKYSKNTAHWISSLQLFGRLTCRQMDSLRSKFNIRTSSTQLPPMPYKGCIMFAITDAKAVLAAEFPDHDPELISIFVSLAS